MLTLEEAQAKLLELAPRTGTVILPTDSASGQFLARDLQAKRTQPAADLSAMDGYAICGDGPWLRVGESRAGSPFNGKLESGQCTRISTGAHMPSGADRVLIQENAHVHDKQVSLAVGEAQPPSERHVRKAGFDFVESDMVLSRGTRLGPGQIGLALAASHDSVPVYEKPTIAILDSGDELVGSGQACGPHQIPASNGAMIASMLQPYVTTTEYLGPVPDDLDALAKALDRAESDILITSGGASVGDHDLMQRALGDWGAEIDFWKVAIKPGKPLMVATRERSGRSQVILGLPGNPVSSFVTCFLFGLPLVRAAMGDFNPMPLAHKVISDEALPAVGKRREFLRGISDGNSVQLAASQDSSALRSLASANCLIDRLPESASVSPGETVAVYNLQNG